MFNRTPNLTIKKMVEITEAVGVELRIQIKIFEKNKREKTDTYMAERYKTSVRENKRTSNGLEKIG